MSSISTYTNGLLYRYVLVRQDIEELRAHIVQYEGDDEKGRATLLQENIDELERLLAAIRAELDDR